MATETARAEPLWSACDAWLRRAEEVVTASAETLNTLNVFPVPDADTGSNVMLSLRGIAAAVPSFERAGLDAVVQAAILSAHGNSGAILAEMITSVCRALQEGTEDASQLPPGRWVAELLHLVATAATRAVARPVLGTILTVAAQAADSAQLAAQTHPGGALVVAQAARTGAQEALLRTPEQLEVLSRAGVVDAGGQAFVLLLDVLVEVLGGPKAQPLEPVVPPTAQSQRPDESQGPAKVEYEVMYAICGAQPSSLDDLRAELSELGHSVVLVGDQSIAQVHVHLAEPGPAVEAGVSRGRLSQIRITALEDTAPEARRSVVCMVVGQGLARAVTEMGGVAVQAERGQLTIAELTEALVQCGGDAVILPNNMENLESASHVARLFRGAGRRVAVIPTVAQVQGLAAIAVHEPSADFEAAVVAMSTAAGHTRQGAVTIAESSAMTMAGRCRRGDVLGVVEGDFVEIGTSVTEVAWGVLQRLLAAGGELVTLVSGAAAEAGLVEELSRRILDASNGVDVETLVGGQQRYLLLIGVE